MRVCRLVLCLIAGIVLAPLVAAGQGASVKGIVADRQSGVVVGAGVLLTGESGPSRETTTAPDGAFRFDNVRPGQYTLVVSAPAFAS